MYSPRLLGFANRRDLAEYLGIERRELAQLIRDSNDQDASKLDALAGLDELAESLGFDNPRELAEYLGVSRSELAQLVQESDTPNELAEALGYDNAAALAEELGVDRRRACRAVWIPQRAAMSWQRSL